MTNEEMKYRFFGLHLGQIIRVENAIGSGEYELLGLKKVGQLHAWTDQGWFPLESCQLILKPLSEISDEDAKAITDIVFKGSRYPITYIDGGTNLKIASGSYQFYIWYPSDDDCVVSLEENGDTCSFKQFEVTDYLRSRGYILPYLDKDPAKEGWAVLEDKTMIQ